MEKPWKTGSRPPMVPPKVSPCQAKDLSLAADRSWWKIYICIYVCTEVNPLMIYFMCIYYVYIYIFICKLHIYIFSKSKKNRKSRKVIHHIKPITITWVLGRTWATRSNELGTGTFKGQGCISIQGLHSGSCLGVVMKSWFKKMLNGLNTIVSLHFS